VGAAWAKSASRQAAFQFENQGFVQVSEVIRSLRALDAGPQADVLSLGKERLQSKEREKIQSVDDFVEAALEEEFDDLDDAYYGCSPRITELLETDFFDFAE
jgi:hypothetical protein